MPKDNARASIFFPQVAPPPPDTNGGGSSSSRRRYGAPRPGGGESVVSVLTLSPGEHLTHCNK